MSEWIDLEDRVYEMFAVLDHLDPEGESAASEFIADRLYPTVQVREDYSLAWEMMEEALLMLKFLEELRFAEFTLLP